MQKVFTKILFFFVIYWSLMFVFKSLVPVYLGNHQLTQKMLSFKPEANKINTVFFGNSTVNRQIDPIVFDQFTTSNTYSYNLAADATPMMERSFLIEWFVKNYKVERIILLVGHSADLRDVNLNTLRIVSYHDWKRLLYTFKYRAEKPREILKHIGAYIKNQLAMFRVKELLKYRSIQNATPQAFKSNRGYLALDIEKQATNFQSEKFAEEADKYKQLFAKVNQKIDFSRFTLTHKDRAIIEECNRLQKILESHGTELIFLFSPNSPHYYHYDLKNSIYMGDGIDFQEYYKFENRYDPGHLNSKGADIYSKRLGLLFNKFTK